MISTLVLQTNKDKGPIEGSRLRAKRVRNVPGNDWSFECFRSGDSVPRFSTEALRVMFLLCYAGWGFQHTKDLFQDMTAHEQLELMKSFEEMRAALAVSEEGVARDAFLQFVQQ